MSFYLGSTEKILFFEPLEALFNQGVSGLFCTNLARLRGYSFNRCRMFDITNRCACKIHYYLLSCFFKKYQVDDGHSCLLSQS